jgi:hypothetical protein
MNDDTRFDPVDDELRRRFAGPGASPTDPDAVLDTLRPRMQRARTRRRAAFTGAVATVAVAVVALSVALGGGGGGSVRTPPASHSTVPRPDPSVTSTPPLVAPTPNGDVSSGTNGGGSLNGTTGSADSGTGNSGTTSGDGTPTAPTTAPSGSEQQTYTSAGGSITIAFTGGQVSLVSSSPAPGYGVEIHDNGPTRVEVRFNNGQTEWRIRVDVVNGVLQPEITQN